MTEPSIAPGIRRLLLVLAATLPPALALAAEIAPDSWKQLSLSRDAEGKSRVVAGNLKGRTRILMAWRSDCAPCLLELRHISALERVSEAKGVELIALALDPPPVAVGKLNTLGVRPRRSWYALDNDDQVIAALGQDLPALPVSIAISRRGEMCGRRIGVLGTDIVRSWAGQCK